MNNRNLAIKISKHPLLRKLTEDKAIPNSIVARLIVEELSKASYNLLLENVDVEKMNKMTDRAIKGGDKQLINNMKNMINNALQDATEAENQEAIKALNGMLQKVENALKLKELKDIIDREIEDHGTKTDSGEIYDGIKAANNTILTRKQTLTPDQFKEIESYFQEKIKEKQSSGEEEGAKEKSPEIDMERLLQKFSNFIPRALFKGKVINENIGDLIKILKPDDEKFFGQEFGKRFERQELKALRDHFEDKKNIAPFIEKYLKGKIKNYDEVLAAAKKLIVEPESDDTKDAPKSGPQIPIQQENVDEFLKSTDEFLKEFYRKSYKIEQATAIDEVLKSLGKMVEDENLAKAAQRVPDKKEEPKPEEATAEEQPEQEKTISEQEEQKQASKDELRNLRIGMNSLLKRINYSRKALDRFKDTAGKGSVLASGDKKKFIKVLKEIQQSIRRIGLVLQQVLRDTEKLNEEESETIKEFREIQKKYDLASEAISNMVELLKPGGVSEIPKMLTNDAYSALVDLAIHFPSVAPFGAGKENRKDFNEYDVKFNSAIEKVKDDLQNVFSLMKTGQAGEESLILALDGIKEFSAQIQAIFGVTSEFEELKVDRNEEAAEGESKSDKDPEEEKYSDEISEEDKELITAAIQDHKEFYEKALETFRKLEAADPDKTTMSPEAAVNTGQSSFDLSSLNEIMKKTEDLIKSLNNSRKIAQNFMKRVKSGNASQRYQQELRKVLNRYINEYEKLNDTIRTRDFSSVLDTGEKRTEKVSKLIDVAKKYLDEKSAINNLFVAILNDDFGDEKDLEMIWKALKDADGKEAERLTGDMKYKVKRAGQNIKNIFKGKLDPSKLDFSSFKQFIGMVADKISKTSIKLRDKINEDEEQDVELEPNEQEEQSDEELKIYQDNLSNALKHMNSFVSLFASFNHAIEQIEKDVGRTKFLEVFDKEFSSVKGLLASMDNHLKKVSDMFGKTITVREAELYGFPPKGTEIPEPAEVEGDPDVISDITDFKEELSRNLKVEIGVIEKEIKEEGIGVLYKFYKHVISLNENKSSQDYANNLHKQIKDKDGLNLNKKGIKQFIFALKQNEREQLSDAINFLSTKKQYVEGFKKMLGQTGSTEPTDTDNEKQPSKPTFDDEQKDQEELFDYIVKALEDSDIFQDKIEEISRDWDSGYEDDTGQKLDPSKDPQMGYVKRNKPQTPEQFIRNQLVRFRHGNKEVGRRLIRQVIIAIENYSIQKNIGEKAAYEVAEGLFYRKDVLDYFQSRLKKEPSEEKAKEKARTDTSGENGSDSDLDKLAIDAIDKQMGASVQEQIATKLKPLIREMLNKGK